jgi:hypothetical protein
MLEGLSSALTQVRQMVRIDINSPLQNIITKRAIVTTIVSRENQAVILDNIIMHDFNGNININHNLFYFTLFAALAFAHAKFSYKYEQKLQNVQMFSNMRKISNQIIFVVALIFTKNVENAI